MEPRAPLYPLTTPRIEPIKSDATPQFSSNAITSQKHLVNLRKHQQELNGIVKSSNLWFNDSIRQTEAIMSEFNKKVNETCFSTSVLRIPFRSAWYLNRDEVLLGHRNKTAELASFDERHYIMRALNVSPAVTTDIDRSYKISSPFFGWHGTYVLNVPVNQYAKAMSGTYPLIYGPGPHVIHDMNFRFNAQTGFVHQFTPYINHESLHILRVPAGKIAKVWIGTEPFLLESQEQPYVFNTPFFRVDKKTEEEYFFDSTEKVIKHGSLKRLLPHTGEVAITYNNGVLQVIAPCESFATPEPFIIDSSTHEVVDFLPTGIETMTFPSDETKVQRKKEDPRISNEDLNYEIVTTKDSLKIGVKLLVAYRIKHPQLALQNLLSEKGIINHIENCALVDMAMAIRECTSQEFLSSVVTKPSRPEPSETLQQIDEATKKAPRLSDHKESYQDLVKRNLTRDLAEYGIELIRLNFETPKIMDSEIAKQMSAQSLKTADASTREAVLEQNYRIAQREAEQRAKTQQIAAEQEATSRRLTMETDANARKLTAEIDAHSRRIAATQDAESKRIAATQEAESKRIAWDQQNEAIKSRAEAETKAAQQKAEAIRILAEAENKAANLKGEAYEHNKTLFDLRIKELEMEALAKAQFVPPAMMKALMSGNLYASPFTLFGNPAIAAPEPVTVTQIVAKEEKPETKLAVK